MKLTQVAKVLQVLRDELGKKDLSIHWVELLIYVAEAGDLGVTTVEVSKALDMGQPIASRTVKLLSKYVDPITKTLEGADLLVTFYDMEHRKRLRVALSTKGKELVSRLETILVKG